ncbi:ATP-binding protein [Actinomadura rupiterrae]|uniref:ATP-binding protein n=1 Tax=Actinomadura rupiterrae TaxID=559627 RepID=UPI0020A53AAA|nr:ATP-binding protein [Actinomadura rupiterrae]MCP2337735.1 serine/threonine-protein kinase RsbW [Actinomadura rupiterrae]
MTLPRDAGSAPLARHTLDASLRGLGVDSDVRADIALALGEACANVIQHAVSSTAYEIRAQLDQGRCVVDVIDGGGGDTPPNWTGGRDPIHAENGRGLTLIHAFTDDLEISGRANKDGAVVHFEKSFN